MRKLWPKRPFREFKTQIHADTISRADCRRAKRLCHVSIMEIIYIHQSEWISLRYSLVLEQNKFEQTSYLSQLYQSLFNVINRLSITMNCMHWFMLNYIRVHRVCTLKLCFEKSEMYFVAHRGSARKNKQKRTHLGLEFMCRSGFIRFIVVIK